MSEEQPTDRAFSALSTPRSVEPTWMDDLGFASRERFMLSRQEKAEAHRKLVDVVVGRLANAQQLVNQGIQPDGDVRPVLQERLHLTADYRKGIIAYRAIERIGCDDMGQHELLKSIDAVLEFLELVLIERGHGGESPVVGEPALSTPPANTPHCLSETAE
jgi:hypothetical protein